MVRHHTEFIDYFLASIDSYYTITDNDLPK